MRRTLLQVSGLRKTYRTGRTEVVAVDDLSFSLRAGGALGIVGESGSGKTTTARMLIGLERPDAGQILVQGEPLAAAVRGRAARLARAKAVQIVFQDPYLSLDGRISIGATIDGVLRLHGLADPAARAARVRELLAQVGLGDREAAALPRRLSGGQRQRAAIARALAVEPGCSRTRRGGVGARRLGAGAGAQPARRTSAATPASAWSSSATTWPSCGTCATRRSSCTGAAPWNTGPSPSSSPRLSTRTRGCCWPPYPVPAGIPTPSAGRRALDVLPAGAGPSTAQG